MSTKLPTLTLQGSISHSGDGIAVATSIVNTALGTSAAGLFTLIFNKAGIIPGTGGTYSFLATMNGSLTGNLKNSNVGLICNQLSLFALQELWPCAPAATSSTPGAPWSSVQSPVPCSCSSAGFLSGGRSTTPWTPFPCTGSAGSGARCACTSSRRTASYWQDRPRPSRAWPGTALGWSRSSGGLGACASSCSGLWNRQVLHQ